MPKKKRKHAVTTLVPKSLNYGVRRLENERIERENQAFAQRLFDKSAFIKKKNFDDQYFAHVKYMKNI